MLNTLIEFGANNGNAIEIGLGIAFIAIVAVGLGFALKDGDAA